jgi:hypothetical protein
VLVLGLGHGGGGLVLLLDCLVDAMDGLVNRLCGLCAGLVGRLEVLDKVLI